MRLAALLCLEFKPRAQSIFCSQKQKQFTELWLRNFLDRGFERGPLQSPAFPLGKVPQNFLDFEQMHVEMIAEISAILRVDERAYSLVRYAPLTPASSIASRAAAAQAVSPASIRPFGIPQRPLRRLVTSNTSGELSEEVRKQIAPACWTHVIERAAFCGSVSHTSENCSDIGLSGSMDCSRILSPFMTDI